MAGPAYDPRRHPAQLVRRLHQRAAQLFTQNTLRAHLSATQFVSLVSLLQFGPMNLAQLGRVTAMDPATATVLVRKLESEGLIVKTRSPEDQRVVVLSLTSEGEAVAQAHIPVSQAAGAKLLAPLSAAEQAQFLSLLARLLPDES